MTRYGVVNRSSVVTLLLGLLLLATTTSSATAQTTVGIPGLFEVNFSLPDEVNDAIEDVGDFFGELLGDDDDDSVGDDDDDAFDLFGGLENFTLDIDFDELFTDLGEFIGESLRNFTLPAELQDLFSLPEFDDVEFSFGGNCTLCDVPNMTLNGTVDSIPCKDWELVAKLGIVDGTTQCDLLRVVAAEHCGCPVPDVNEGRTCPICPGEGEEPGVYPGRFLDTVGVTCWDLLNPPAVDGNQTCNTIETIASQCLCSVITETLPPEVDRAVSRAVTSAATTTTSTQSLALVILAVASWSMLLL
ncbi:expressed unknown protein [Seminavis robusta]|uniref:Uncharacterized protein n=1 Tax=Seminavis robusta TaxID=568900 RepID=A0A9N8DMF4_9STRA|nr:expressed unknown protein [Seminavis robusta]|eukprot:Sro136_g064080.1 n/a (302) ;mRNA; f:52623-53528